MVDRSHKTRQKLTCRIVSKPRNPLVALAAKRVAGAHRKSESARRSVERRALRRFADTTDAGD